MSHSQAQTIIYELIIIATALGAIFGSMLANTFTGWGHKR